MNFNRVLTLLPLLAIIGCGSSDSAYMSEPTASTGSATAPEPAAAEVKLASQINDPAMKSAAIKRAVIRNGSLSVRVVNVEDAERKVNDHVAKAGGFVASSQTSDLTATAPTITLKLRTPADGFDRTMLFFEGLGTRLSKSVSGEDVTAQIVDFDARLKIMRAQEDSFRKMLSAAKDTSTAADMQTRIMDLRAQIEGLAAQRSTMADLASLSTIELTLIGETKGIAAMEDKGWVQETWHSSTATLGVIFQGLGAFGIFLVVLSPIWLPIAFLIHRTIRKSSRAA